MTFGEPMWDSNILIFWSNEVHVSNFEAHDLEMIQVHKRLEGLQ